MYDRLSARVWRFLSAAVLRSDCSVLRGAGVSSALQGSNCDSGSWSTDTLPQVSATGQECRAIAGIYICQARSGVSRTLVLSGLLV